MFRIAKLQQYRPVGQLLRKAQNYFPKEIPYIIG